MQRSAGMRGFWVVVAATMSWSTRAGGSSGLDLVSFFDTLEGEGKLNHIAIDIGAGVRDADPVFALYDRGWAGVMIDADEAQRAKMDQRFPSTRIAKRIALVEPETAGAIIDAALRSAVVNSTRRPDLVKIDIDSFDCVVLDALLFRERFRPKAIVTEVNVKFPPTVFFALLQPASAASFNSERRGHFYGCSLAYQVRALLEPAGYRLVRLDWNNALYVRRDVLVALDAHRAAFPRYSIGDWDRLGYFDRPQRKRMFGFNEPILDWRISDDPVEAILNFIRGKTWRSHAGLPFVLGKADDLKLYHFDRDGRLVARPPDDAPPGNYSLGRTTVLPRAT